MTDTGAKCSDALGQRVKSRRCRAEILLECLADTMDTDTDTGHNKSKNKVRQGHHMRAWKTYITMRAGPDMKDNALAILHKRPDGGGETTRDNVGSSFHNGCRNRATDVMGRSLQLE